MRRSALGFYGDLSHTIAEEATQPLPFIPTMLQLLAALGIDPNQLVADRPNSN